MPTTEELAAGFASALQPPAGGAAAPPVTEPSQPDQSATAPTAPVPGVTPPVAAPVTPPAESEVPAAEAQPADDPLAEDEQFENAESPIDPKSTRGQQIWANHQNWRNLARPIEEGGIGHEPTPADIQNYWRSHQVSQQILFDVDSGNPEFLTGMAKTNPQGMAQILAELPNFLTTGFGGSNPEVSKVFEPVRQNLVKAVCKDLVGHYLEQARVQAEPTGRAELLATARNLAANFLGEDLGEDALAVKPVSPHEAERRRLEEEKRQIAQTREQYATQLYNQFDTATTAEIDNAVKTTVSSVLKAYEGRSGYKATAQVLTQMVQEHLRTSPNVANEARLLWQQARRAVASGQAPDPKWAQAHAQRIVGTYMKWAKPFINQHMRSVARDSGLFQAPPATKQPVAPMPPAAASAAPVTAQPMERKPGESSVEFNARRMASMLGRPN